MSVQEYTRITSRFTASELMEMELPPVTWTVPDILPEGVTILGGKPKMGKSWMAYGLTVAVTTGGVALGTKPVEQGAALYLALEDNPRRLRKRLGKLLADGTAPEGLHIWTECPKLDEGGVGEIEEWLSEHPDARLVVIDTLAKVRPHQRGQNVYQEDYAALEALLPLAAEYGVAILIVHHLRKMDADDPMDTISGSTGLSGGVDGFLILKRDRGKADAYLHVDGRDVEEPAELALRWDANLASWTIAGNADEYRMSEERRAIVGLLERSGEPMAPKDIAEALGKRESATKMMLRDMVADRQVVNPQRGQYTLSADLADELTNEPRRADEVTDALQSQEVSIVRGDYGEDVFEDADTAEKPGPWHEHLTTCDCTKCQDARRRGLK